MTGVETKPPASRPDRPRRDHRPLLAAAVVMLLAVAAAGSGALHRVDGPATRKNQWVVPAAISVVAMVALAGAVVIGYAMWPRSGWRSPPRPPRERAGRGVWISAAVVFLLIVFAAFALLVLTGKHRKPLATPTPTTTTRIAPAAPSAAETRHDRAPVHLVWWLAIGSVVVAGALSTALALASRGRGGPPIPAEPPSPSPVGRQAVEASIEALQQETDPRLAVIAAFTAMEVTLGRLGVPRPAWETPFEYVDRILMEVGATAGTAARLAELFEEAKFSSHRVDEEHKAAALDALANLRRELGRAA